MDKSLEQSICEDVFIEFGNWSKRNSQSLLKNICRGKGLSGNASFQAPIVDAPFRPADFTSNWDRDKLEWEYPTEDVFVSDKAGGSPMVRYKASFDVVPRVVPFPPYESCAPISGNLWIGDDSDAMPFMPFADERTFDHHDAQSHYKELGWQRETMNADSM